MDNLNITMEEYIRLKEEKARRHGKVYNWETAKYVSSLNNNENDFRISFDESEDEDYTVIFDKNSFSYKIIYVNDLKTDSENDNEKVNMPSFPSPEPKVSCFGDFDFFKDSGNEFPAIVYNDALKSKSVEQNVLYFNDLFPFNVIYLDDSKSDKDNNDDKIDIKQSSGGGNMIYTDHIDLTLGGNVCTATRHSTAADRKYWCFTDAKKYRKKLSLVLPKRTVETISAVIELNTAKQHYMTLLIAVTTVSLIFEVTTVSIRNVSAASVKSN
ncbi:hypothetical protein Tco_0347836 [Tanacetum coccineum]